MSGRVLAERRDVALGNGVTRVSLPLDAGSATSSPPTAASWWRSRRRRTRCRRSTPSSTPRPLPAPREPRARLAGRPGAPGAPGGAGRARRRRRPAAGDSRCANEIIGTASANRLIGTEFGDRIMGLARQRPPLRPRRRRLPHRADRQRPPLRRRRQRQARGRQRRRPRVRRRRPRHPARRRRRRPAPGRQRQRRHRRRLRATTGSPAARGGTGSTPGPANDRIYAKDGKRDTIDCGRGRDTVVTPRQGRPAHRLRGAPLALDPRTRVRRRSPPLAAAGPRGTATRRRPRRGWRRRRGAGRARAA